MHPYDNLWKRLDGGGLFRPFRRIQSGRQIEEARKSLPWNNQKMAAAARRRAVAARVGGGSLVGMFTGAARTRLGGGGGPQGSNIPLISPPTCGRHHPAWTGCLKQAMAGGGKTSPAFIGVNALAVGSLLSVPVLLDMMLVIIIII